MARTIKTALATTHALACIVSLLGTPVAAVAAAAPFDGSWTVDIATHRGTCKSGSLPIEVRDGKIQSNSPAVNVSGQVGQAGLIRVVVGDGLRKANGSGKLSATSGSGTWNGGLCSGTWAAQRT
jgi:hypothetical protein